MSDDLKEGLYGKTINVTLADGNEYVMREPDLDTLVKLDLKNTDLTDLKNLRDFSYAVLKIDNKDLTKDKFSKLVTMSMLQDESHFMKALTNVLGIGQAGGEEKNG